MRLMIWEDNWEDGDKNPPRCVLTTNKLDY